MESFKTMLKELRQYPIIIGFFAVLAFFLVGGLLLPDAETSELENRPLNQFPTFNTAQISTESLRSGYEGFSAAAASWTMQFNDYAKDQLLLRDGWISAHSAFELAQGKLENGGVWYAQDGYQIAKNDVWTPNQERTFPLNTQAVCELSQRFPGQVQVIITPSPANTLGGLLRAAPPQIDEDALLDEAFAQFRAAGAEVIDLRPAFADAHSRGEQLYYYTDHHWTTTGGARIAYGEFCRAQGAKPHSPDGALLQSVPGFLGTSYAKTKRPFSVRDTLEYYDYPNLLTVHAIQPDGTVSAETGPLMDKDKLDVYDKYAAFLRGNNGYSELTGSGEGSILLIKDSYGNSFAPYLIESYEKIGIIDLRAWFELDKTILEGGYDDILVLYSFDNFSSDGYARRMMTETQQSLAE